MPYDKLKFIDHDGKEFLLVDEKCPNEKCFKKMWTVDSDRLQSDYKGGGPHQYWSCAALTINDCYKLEE
jgi:hypothetical protein